MQYFLFSLLFVALLSACGQSNSTKVVEKAKEISSAIRPGTLSTTSTGYTMRAKIGGRVWTAASMVSPEAAGRIVGYSKDEYIALPYPKLNLKAGNKITLDEDNAPDLSLNDGCLWLQPQGEIEITKADGTVAEGKFFFSVVCKGKPLMVSEGFFRIVLSNK